MKDLNKKQQVVEMWKILNSHPYFEFNKELQFRSPMYLIDPCLVNDAGEIDDDQSKNIHLHYWYEVLVPHVLDKSDESLKYHYGDNIPDVDYYYDSNLDGGGETYEDAIINLYHTICKKFGYPNEV